MRGTKMSQDKIIFNQQDLPEEERMELCVKEIVHQTLFALDEAQKERRDIVERIQNLKMDLRDFKSGRLDRLLQRHSTFEKNEALSVIEIETMEGQDYSKRPWSPYYLIRFVKSKLKVVVRLPGFFFHEYTSGTYDMGKGKTKHL